MPVSRSAPVPRLVAAQVRAVRFRRSPWPRVGLDPADVYPFLAVVADELDRLGREIAAAREDAGRVKEALRDWQTRYGRP